MQNGISTDGMSTAMTTSSVEVQTGASTIDTTLDLLSEDDADDEQGSMCSEYGPDFNKRRRKRKRISKTTKGVYLARSRDRGKSSDVDELSSELERSTSPEPADEDNLETVPEKENKEETISEKLARLQIQYQRRVIDREGRKTIAEELDQKARQDFRFTEVDLDPTIIELQVLERGQYFGVTPLLFPDQPSLSVISNGAECLVLSKKLFKQWASEKCLRNLRQTESPYPSDQELMRKLQDVVNWQATRSVIFSQLDTEIQVKKAKRRQFLPSYGGEYCFRTGPA